MFRVTQLFRKFSQNIDHIPTLKQFVNKSSISSINNSEILSQSVSNRPTFHIETYGCQMNENDSQIVRSVLRKNYNEKQKADADIVFINTCAIREAAQQKIYHRINQLKKTKIIGILGCMAERLKQKMFDRGVHIVCGPDAYRDLPRLIDMALNKENSINVQLSVEETYADITPIRKNINNVSAFLSIMRGCNNMCSFCIVPFVRGRQRSRTLQTILNQIKALQKEGVRQITFLGQNVNSYHDTSATQFYQKHKNSQGFSQMFKLRDIAGYRFQHLLDHAARAFPDIRFRFTSPHPKDFPEGLLQTIARHHNICNHIHLPIQSGNTQMLFRMRRNHTRQSYLNLVKRMKQMIPGVAITTDMMCGFCGETQEQFQDTISILQEVKYDHGFMFAYSMREKTHAHRNFEDDVPEHTKKQRLIRMIDTLQTTMKQTCSKDLGKYHLLLVEKTTKKDQNRYVGKTDTFKKGYFNKNTILPVVKDREIIEQRKPKPGDYVFVKVTQAWSRGLECQTIAIAQTLKDYYNNQGFFQQLYENRVTEMNE